MAEYIEREALLNALKEERKNGNFVFTSKWIKEIMDNLPAADVVEVVRCKDCKNRYVPCRCALWYATANDTEYFVERGDDFFCSYAEKKEGAEE